MNRDQASLGEKINCICVIMPEACEALPMAPVFNFQMFAALVFPLSSEGSDFSTGDIFFIQCVTRESRPFCEI